MYGCMVICYDDSQNILIADIIPSYVYTDILFLLNKHCDKSLYNIKSADDIHYFLPGSYTVTLHWYMLPY